MRIIIEAATLSVTGRNWCLSSPSTSQVLYIKTIAKRFEVTMASMLPAVAGDLPLSKAKRTQTESEMEDVRGLPYREAAGALIWASIMTRLDIIDAVRTVTKFFTTPDRPTGEQS